LNKFLGAYNRITFDKIRPYIITDEYLTPFASEFGRLVRNFLIEYGIDKSISIEFAEIVSQIFEYDDAYRFRAQDLFSEITKEDLAERPYYTVDLLALISQSREKNKGQADKFLKIASLFFLLMFSPKATMAIETSVEQSNFERLQFDEADRYWVSTRNDYNFMGKTYEERSEGLYFPSGVKLDLNKHE
jgi:hypothetical protein